MPLLWPKPPMVAFEPLVCPQCVAEGAPRRVYYDFCTDRYLCETHGPVLTAEWLDPNLEVSRG